MIWWIEQIDWMIFVYWEWWISIEATKICYFGLALSGIGSQPTRLSDALNLKNLKAIWDINLMFCFHWNYKKYHTILANPFAGFFTFDLFDLLILIPGVHCYIVLVSNARKVLQPEGLWKTTFIQYWYHIEQLMRIQTLDGNAFCLLLNFCIFINSSWHLGLMKSKKVVYQTYL